MSDTIILRVHSKAGRSRIEISSKASFFDLKQELEQRLQIPAKQVKLFTDQALKRELKGRETHSVSAIGHKNGDMLHVGNQTVELTSVTEAKVKAAAKAAEEKKDEAMTDANAEEEKKEQPPEEQYKPKCTHPPGRKCLNCLGVDKENFDDVTYGQCNHAPGVKCPNCLEKTAGQFKHESFDNFLKEMRKKCAKSHASNMKCQNCTFDQEYSYKVNYNCKSGHEPYPKGVCGKCRPPSVVLRRQVYRHVDYVSFMNYKDVAKFVGFWQRTGYYEQRMGYLYGYYSEDPNYPEGVRCNIEAIYDPPQIGDVNGVQELDDPNRHKVDMIASALGLEKVGHIFSTVDTDGFLRADMTRRAAALQQEHCYDHPQGYKVPKYVTIVARKKGEAADNVELEAYMISDQGQALERDNCFGNSKDKNTMTVREPTENEMMPTVLTKGKATKEFPPDFFLVSLAHGQPAATTDHGILKLYDFPCKNRDPPAEAQMFSGYLKKYAAEPSERMFANFQLLLYLADYMDLDTAIGVAQNVADEKPLDPALIDLFKAL